jgi:hypothetical protein
MSNLKFWKEQWNKITERSAVTDTTGAMGNESAEQTGIKIKWIEYDGQKVKILFGVFGDKAKSTILKSYSGTSGHDGFQIAGKQDVPNDGPTPEGEYKINLTLSFFRKTGTINMSECIIGNDKGIQLLSWGVKRGGGTCNYPGWGQWRARLEKVKVSNSRDNFYFHDSYKGESSGCIETETDLYYDLYHLYKTDGYQFVRARVAYSSLSQSTNGNTRQQPPPWGVYIINGYWVPDMSKFPEKSRL